MGTANVLSLSDFKNYFCWQAADGAIAINREKNTTTAQGRKNRHGSTTNDNGDAPPPPPVNENLA